MDHACTHSALTRWTIGAEPLLHQTVDGRNFASKIKQWRRATGAHQNPLPPPVVNVGSCHDLAASPATAPFPPRNFASPPTPRRIQH